MIEDSRVILFGAVHASKLYWRDSLFIHCFVDTHKNFNLHQSYVLFLYCYCILGGFPSWGLVGNEGMRALENPLKGIGRALVPSFATKNQPVSILS